MEFSRQKYWSRLHFLLHGIFLTQRSNPHLMRLLQGTWILYHWANWEARGYTLARDKNNLIWKNVTPWFKMFLTHLFWNYWTVYHMIFICLLLWGFWFVFSWAGSSAGAYISDSCSNLGSPGNWNTAKKTFFLQVSTQPPSLWTYNDLSPNPFSHQISIFKSLSQCGLHFYHHWYHFITGLPSTPTVLIFWFLTNLSYTDMNKKLPYLSIIWLLFQILKCSKSGAMLHSSLFIYPVFNYVPNTPQLWGEVGSYI